MTQQGINTNDNALARKLAIGSDDTLHLVNDARYLIGKYISAYWKNDPNDIDYVDMEVTLRDYLKMETRCDISRNLKIEWIARVLGVSPLALCNDKQLPF